MTGDVIGLDLSLTATGIATTTHLGTLTPAVKGVARIHWIRGQIVTQCKGARLVVLEDIFAGPNRQTTIQLAMVHGAVRVALYSQRVPFIVVTPQTVKTYALGKGSGHNTTKLDVVKAAMNRGGIDPDDDNQADAWWLRAIGCALLGQPCVVVPDSHNRALANLQLPLPEGPT